MPATKDLAVKANDAAFQNAFQNLFNILQNRLTAATDDAERQAANTAASNGLTMLKNTHDRLVTIINSVFP